jgi:hypothetical protein
MRLPTLVLFTLAAVVAGTLEANAQPSETPTTPMAQLVSSDSTVPVAAAEPINDSISDLSISSDNQPSVSQLLATEQSAPASPNQTDLVSQASTTEVEANRDTKANCVAQAQGARTDCPRPQAIPPLEIPEVSTDEFESSPALSIYIPVGFGADRNTLFVSGTYQASTREDNDDDNKGAFGVGLGLGNADKAVGLELSYVFDDFNEDFPDGGFNAKLHRRFGDVGMAVGYNGFANTGRNDYEHSRYGVITGVLRTRPSVHQLFSRISLTVGVGDGQFRSNGAVDAGENNANVFGNVAIRVAQPLSAIVEWTGVDLAAGLSIAPIKNFPWVITPAVRDIMGAGDHPRFVLGTGISIQF